MKMYGTILEQDGRMAKLVPASRGEETVLLEVSEAVDRIVYALANIPAVREELVLIDTSTFDDINTLIDQLTKQLMAREDIQAIVGNHQAMLRQLLDRSTLFDDAALNHLPLDELVLTDRNRNTQGYMPRKLGEGGFGYVAFLLYEGKKYAVKILKTWQVGISGEDASDIATMRFLGEAEAMTAIGEGVPSVLQHGEVDGRPYFIMEYIDGPDLSQINKGFNAKEIEGNRRPERWIYKTVASAMATMSKAHFPTGDESEKPVAELSEYHSRSQLLEEAVHAESVASASLLPGVLHRDIKPSNIMVKSDGAVIVTDFGMKGASNEGETNQLTGTGVIAGSPAYMAPELFVEGLRGASTKSDVYAFGITLFEMLTGKPPFTGSITKVMSAHTNAVPALELITHPRIRELLGRMLAKDPNDRPELSECHSIVSTVASEGLGEEENLLDLPVLLDSDEDLDKDEMGKTMAAKMMEQSKLDPVFSKYAPAERTYVQNRGGQYVQRRRSPVALLRQSSVARLTTVAALDIAMIAGGIAHQVMQRVDEDQPNKSVANKLKDEGEDNGPSVVVAEPLKEPVQVAALTTRKPSDRLTIWKTLQPNHVAETPNGTFFNFADSFGGKDKKVPNSPFVQTEYVKNTGDLRQVTFSPSKGVVFMQNSNGGTPLRFQSGAQAIRSEPMTPQRIRGYRKSVGLEGTAKPSITEYSMNMIALNGDDRASHILVIFVQSDAEDVAMYYVADESNGHDWVYDNPSDFLRKLQELGANKEFSQTDFTLVEGEKVSAESRTAAKNLMADVQAVVHAGKSGLEEESPENITAGVTK
ncbi:MAG: serine/threonine-protein kinase [bacterium]|nr:serine/threonine-protein kinase [bacterium]